MNTDWQFILNFVFGGGILLAIIAAIFNAGKLFSRFNSMGDDIERVERDIKYIKSLVLTIKTALIQADIIKNALFSTSSPKHLTELGNKILTESGFKQVLDNNKTRFFQVVKAKKSNLKYDIENTFIDYMFSLRKDPLVDQLKEYIFEQGIDLSDALTAAALYLRDLYFTENNLK